MTGPGPQGPGPADGGDHGAQPVPPSPGPPEAAGSHAVPPRPTGGMRFQDPASVSRREPTLAEQRERERVRREAEEQARRQAEQDAADEATKRKRRSMLIGGGVAVGLVGVIAATYLAVAGGDDEYDNAQCTNDQGQVVEDRYCSGSGSSGAGGMFFFFSGGSRYQYSYGSNAPVGARANGSPTPLSGKSYANSSGNAVTSDGKTGGAVSRGGFGSKSGGSSSKSGSTSGGKSSGS